MIEMDKLLSSRDYTFIIQLSSSDMSDLVKIIDTGEIRMVPHFNQLAVGPREFWNILFYPRSFNH